MESGDLKSCGNRVAGLDLTLDRSIEDLGRLVLSGRIVLTMMDNHYYQFQSGFLDDDTWNAQLSTLKRNLANPASAVRIALDVSPGPLRTEFIKLCNTLIADYDSEVGE